MLVYLMRLTQLVPMDAFKIMNHSVYTAYLFARSLNLAFNMYNFCDVIQIVCVFVVLAVVVVHFYFFLSPPMAEILIRCFFPHYFS